MNNSLRRRRRPLRDADRHAHRPGRRVDIPMVFVGRADGLRILGMFDAATYQCTGAAAETAADTDAPAVGHARA